MTTSYPGPTPEFFDAAYRQRAPWDVGKAQPELMAVLDEHPPTGPVLDVGCGTGDLVLALAERGLSVVGVDLAVAAIEQAKEKAAKRPADVGGLVEFRVADALALTQLPGPFNAVTDSGFFHVFGSSERQQFVRQLAEKLPAGGRYYLLGFAITFPMPNAPREVREEELRTLFSAEQRWRILMLRPAQFVTVGGNVPAIAACMERTAY
jgi:ubiquinone/menaquinone biosynthesis C-methylase UbiE